MAKSRRGRRVSGSYREPVKTNLIITRPERPLRSRPYRYDPPGRIAPRRVKLSLLRRAQRFVKSPVRSQIVRKAPQRTKRASGPYRALQLIQPAQRRRALACFKRKIRRRVLMSMSSGRGVKAPGPYKPRGEPC